MRSLKPPLVGLQKFFPLYIFHKWHNLAFYYSVIYFGVKNELLAFEETLVASEAFVGQSNTNEIKNSDLSFFSEWKPILKVEDVRDTDSMSLL